jgi:hypothetical protein
MIGGLHRPFHSQFGGHVRCCLLLQEYSKLRRPSDMRRSLNPKLRRSAM